MTRGIILERPLQQVSALPADNAALLLHVHDLERQLDVLKTRLGIDEDCRPRVNVAGLSSRISRRGLLVAAAGAAAGLVAGQATPAVAANGDPVRLGQLNQATVSTTVKMTGGSAGAVFGEATATSGIVSGIYGRSWSTTGRGISGVALAQSGGNYGVYGQSNSTSGTGVRGWAIQSTGTTYGMYGQSTSTSGTGVRGDATATSGPTSGVSGSSSSTSGKGVYGTAPASSGATYGVLGESASTTGVGVRGNARATSGTTVGVLGAAISPDGYGVYSSGRLKSTGRIFVAAPNSAPVDTDLNNGMISFYLDEGTNKLKIRVRYSTGVYKTGSVNLS
jgi:hypothetical protein